MILKKIFPGRTGRPTPPEEFPPGDIYKMGYSVNGVYCDRDPETLRPDKEDCKPRTRTNPKKGFLSSNMLRQKGKGFELSPRFRKFYHKRTKKEVQDEIDKLRGENP